MGDYYDSSNNDQGLLLTESSGAWRTGVEAPLPANANTNPKVFLSSVSCASPGNCTAVGSYINSSGKQQGLLLTENSGTWGAGVQAPLPAGATTAGLAAVSCASAGNCSAVGDYTDSAGTLQGLLLSESSGAWGAGVKATLPAGSLNVEDISSVSCVTSVQSRPSA